MRPTEVPGPGAYDGGDDFSLYGSLTKQVTSRRAQFGSTGPRFAGQGSHRPDGVLDASELPGPHSYEPARVAGAAPQVTSTFVSRTKRMPLPKPPTEPKASEFETDVEVLGASRPPLQRPAGPCCVVRICLCSAPANGQFCLFAQPDLLVA